MGGPLRMVRAMATRCFSPPESFRPRSPTWRVVALGQAFDELADLGEVGGLAHFLVGRVGAAVADVVGDGVVEQHGVLRDHADGGAEARLGDVAQVLAVDGDAALDDIVEAIEQARDGGLAGAGRADDGDGLAGRDLEADALEDGAIGVVVELHVLEADHRAGDGERLGVGLVLDFGGLIEELEHLLDVGEALADFAVDEADEVERPVDLHQEGVEQDEIAQRQRSCS